MSTSVKPSLLPPGARVLGGLLFAAVIAQACGDETPGAPMEDVTADTPLDTVPIDAELDTAEDTEAADVDDREILFPGYLCEEDADCSTGYCYGTATPQGAFEPAVCQLTCLQLNDFRRYCNSDRDCCSGRCCLGCGAKEGLCVLSLPSQE